MSLLLAAVRTFNKPARAKNRLVQALQLVSVNAASASLVTHARFAQLARFNDPHLGLRRLKFLVKPKSKQRDRRWLRRHTRVRFSLILRRLVVRMLHSLTGSSVCLLLCRNLQRRLSSRELAYVWLQSQRIFLRMPADLSSFRRMQGYP